MMEKPVLKLIDWGVERKYEILAVAMENYMRFKYHPPVWKESEKIGTVFGYIGITSQNAKDFLEAFNAGHLEEIFLSHEDNRFQKYPCFRDAVQDFFEKGLHKEHVPKI